MKTKIKKLLLFIVRFIFILIMFIVVLARNTMMYLDTAGIGEIIRLLEKYKTSFSLENINGQDLFIYKSIYLINEYYLSILIVIFIVWIALEVILSFLRKDRRSIDE